MKNKIIASGLAIVIVGLLVLAGSANALTFTADGISKGPHAVNETVTFTGTIVGENTNIDINSISLVTDLDQKKEQVICTIDSVGKIISGCEGISISQVDNGYGYGQKLSYQISIDLAKSKLSLGNNKIYLTANTSNGQVSSDKYQLVVKPSTPKK